MNTLQKKLIGLAIAIMADLLYGSVALAGQLEFSYPADGAVVRPGQTIPVTILTDETMKMVTLFSSAHLLKVSEGASENEFLLTASPIIPLGSYQLKVAAFDGNDKIVKKIDIHVEIDETPKSFSVNESVNFEGKGQRIPVRFVGHLDGGAEIWLTHSAKTKYKIGDQKIATVSDDGVVTSVGPGGTYLTVSYGEFNRLVPVNVEFGDGDIPLYKIVVTQNGSAQFDKFGNYIVNLKIINSSNTSMWDMSLNGAILNSTNSIAIIPTTFTNTKPNTSEDVRITFPPSAGVSKSNAVLQLKGSYVANLLNGHKSQPGALSSSLRISLP